VAGRGKPEVIEASCHCGAVRLTVDTAPETVTDCNCSICRRSGMLCAYYSPTRVRIVGATDVYMWGDRSIEFHRCKTCGCVTHWTPIDRTYDRMGVNARMMDPDVLATARVRRFDGAQTWTYLEEG
jgi:hypothetical protein